jgi:formate-dependent nitrite reductase cytochrome c552 subunit
MLLVQTRPVNRFKESFIKQFAQKEASSLIMRTRKKRMSPSPEIVCLVAALPFSDPRTKERGHVVGTLDIRPPRSAGGMHPTGVPQVTPPSAM